MPFLSSAPDDREGARPTLIIQFILMETSGVGLGRDLSYSYVRTTYVYTHAYQVRETFSLSFFSSSFLLRCTAFSGRGPRESESETNVSECQ